MDHLGMNRLVLKFRVSLHSLGFSVPSDPEPEDYGLAQQGLWVFSTMSVGPGFFFRVPSFLTPLTRPTPSPKRVV